MRTTTDHSATTALRRPRRPDLDKERGQPNLPRLHSFANLTACAAFFLLIAGGLVTSTGSGLAVPDWPLSFGKLMPAMIGGVLFEHGHRMIAGAVALLSFMLAGWALYGPASKLTKRLCAAAAVAIALQALLGGLTVILRLPPAVSVSHACLAQAVFCLLVAAAQSSSPWWQLTLERGSGTMWRLGALSFGALALQLVWGALLRHTGFGLLLHAAWAGVAALLVWTLGARGAAASRRLPGLWGPSALLSGLLPVQIALGYLSYRARFTAGFESALDRAATLTTAHLAVGALMLGACVVWTMRSWRTR